MADELTAEELEVKDANEVSDEEGAEEEEGTEEEEGIEEEGAEDAEGTADKESALDDPEDLQSKLEELESTNKGLIKSLSAQRSLRQDLQSQLDEIKTAIAEAKLAKTEISTADSTNDKKTPIPVEFDDDGNMFIEPDSIQPDLTVVQTLQEEINQLKRALNDNAVKSQEEQQLQSLLSEKDGYSDAYTLVNKAWSYLKDDVFDAYLEKYDLPAPTTPDQAIDMIMESEELTKDFQKNYPTLNLESVLEAKLLATPRYLRKALDAAVTSKDSSHEALNPSKPASLANANSGGADTPESLFCRVADMSVEDYESLDERTLAKIDKLMAKLG